MIESIRLTVSAGASSGRVTYQKRRNGPAPSTAAASTISFGIDCETCEEDHHRVAGELPDDHRDDRPQRQRRIAEPVLLQAVETDGRRSRG